MLVRDDEARPGKPMTYKLKPDGDTPEIELTANGKPQKGLYQFNPDGTLLLCLAVKGGKPSFIPPENGSNHVLFTLQHRSSAADARWANALFTKGRSHDFGVLPKPGEHIAHKFVVKNICDGAVAVSGATVLPVDDGRQVTNQGAGLGGPMAPGLGPSPLWATIPDLPRGWLQPGEETTIEVVVDQGTLSSAPPKLIIGLTFQVRGITRPVATAPAGPMGLDNSRGRPGQRGQSTLQSTAELVVSPEWKPR